jgi:hypothetical protein
MARTIRVDDEVYTWLQQQARPFEDTPNSVLRRVAALDVPHLQPKEESEVMGAPSPVSRQESSRKFNNRDRERTIEVVEQYFHVKLTRKDSRRKKYLQDENASPYLFLGGREDWHGIPEKILIDGQNSDLDGKLIIVKRSGEKSKIYWSDLKWLLNASGLHVNKEGDRQFNLDWRTDPPFIKEAPNVRLQLLTEIEYADQA